MNPKQYFEVFSQENLKEFIKKCLYEVLIIILKTLKENQESLMTMKQCHKHLDICRTNLSNLVKAGDIPYLRIGNSIRFIKKDVEEAFKVYNTRKND